MTETDRRRATAGSRIPTRIAALALAALVAVACARADADRGESRQETARREESRTLPHYDAAGDLIRPDDFYGWVRVGSSIGLGYNQRPSSGPGFFHDVYLEPSAYRHFAETGEFPEKTMLAMTIYGAAEKSPPATHGYFEGELVGLDIALKDHERFPEGWVYVPFDVDSLGRIADHGTPLPKAAGCFECHSTHAAHDNVFLQFYPVLRRLDKVDLSGFEPATQPEGER